MTQHEHSTVGFDPHAAQRKPSPARRIAQGPNKNIGRRRFLTEVAASAAAMGGMIYIPGVTRAGEPTAESAPSNRLRVGVMGVNGRGLALAHEFGSLGDAEVVYLCDPDEVALNRARDEVTAKNKPTPKTVADFRRILDDPTIDALVVAAPDHWHAPATILACAAGKHVYVEKPACHNPQEGEWMIEAARRANRVVQVGTQRRSSPATIEAMARIHGGELGTVRFARGWINSQRPSIGHGKVIEPPSTLDYELWQGPAPRTAYRDNVIHYHWHWFWNWGTGELGNNGIHMLDVCRWGMQVRHPDKVVCGGGRLFFNDDQETPDTQLATFHFGDRAITWEHRTWHPRGFENQGSGATFYGDKGALVLGSREYVIYDIEGKELSRQANTTGNIEHLRDFIGSIRGGVRSHADVEEGVASTLLCHLGNIAYRTGKTVQCDAQNGHIRDDAEQQALWSRQYEPGWEPRVG